MREAARGKNAVLSLREIGHDGETPHRSAQAECDEDLADAKPADPHMRAKLDASALPTPLPPADPGEPDDDTP